MSKVVRFKIILHVLPVGPTDVIGGRGVKEREKSTVTPGNGANGDAI